MNGVDLMLSWSESLHPFALHWVEVWLKRSSYSDWISLNEPRLLVLHRRNNQLDLARYAEAVGDIMRLDLKIDQPSPSNDRAGLGSRSNDDLPEIITGIPTSNLLPPIRFHGSSHPRSSSPFQTGGSGGSFVRGVVQLTADNPPQVRWTLTIRYGGEDRWRLECVQVGGRGSKRGFFGVSQAESQAQLVASIKMTKADMYRHGQMLREKNTRHVDQSGTGPSTRTILRLKLKLKPGLNLDRI